MIVHWKLCDKCYLQNNKNKNKNRNNVNKLFWPTHISCEDFQSAKLRRLAVFRLEDFPIQYRTANTHTYCET